MNDISNPYELSAFVRYALAGLVIFFGLWLALRTMERDHEKLLKEYQKNVDWLFEKKKIKKTKKVPLLSRSVDEVFGVWGIHLQEMAIAIQGRMLQLSYRGRVAVLVTIMAFYGFMLVYFKMDETSMRRERKALYEQVENAVREKMIKEKNN